MPVRLTTIEVVECPSCGVLISGMPVTEKCGAYVCPFCRNMFDTLKAKTVDVHIIHTQITPRA